MTYQELSSLAIFRGVPEEDMRRFAEMSRGERLADGKTIFLQGEQADRLYVLLDGQVEIRFKPGDGDPLTVTTIEPGGVFGWSSVLGRSSYTSGAVCTRPGRALSVSGEALRELCELHPSTGVVIIERLAEVIAGRLSNTWEAVVDLLNTGVSNEADEERSGDR